MCVHVECVFVGGFSECQWKVGSRNNRFSSGEGEGGDANFTQAPQPPNPHYPHLPTYRLDVQFDGDPADVLLGRDGDPADG